jgi:branched-chain amino acid transport system substrate-binding protein
VLQAAWLLLVAMIAIACSSGGDPAIRGEIVIASDFPTSGADRANGRGPEAGVAFAVQLNASIKGFKITHRPFDDAVNGVHDSQQGVQNVNDMVYDARVLGLVGPFHSNVARAMIPVANRANLVMISPSNADDCLTQDSPDCTPKASSLRDPAQPNSYFRIVMSDSFQGRAMADFAYDTLKITKAAVWSDGEVTGKAVADSFAKRFQSRGGTVVARQDYDTQNPVDFRPFLQRAKDVGAQGIYAGASSVTKGCLARAQSKGIADVYYLGPEGIGTTDCIKDAGDQASDKMYFTRAADPVADAANKELVDGFTKSFSKKDDLNDYTFPAYDCAKILLDAIGRAIDVAGGNMPTRRQVLDAVQKTDKLKLSAGTYSFDRNGDPTSATIAVYQSKGASWTFVKQFVVGQ